MLSARSPLSGTTIPRPKSGRKPLQSINSPANPVGNHHVKSKWKPDWIEFPLTDDADKENYPVCATPTKIESLDASLAEELSAIREKMERLRRDKKKTEEMLRQRHVVLNLQIKELEKRGEVQKVLEIEVDRLYRLKELRSSCMNVKAECTEEEGSQESTSQSPSSELDTER
ncbi:hypothetical protein RJ639_007225 [Escallonia herrerae]|uniref:Uncharacterized protein n=1 Tax=Escallonia herrerae TaxID=1293975 RepID=A0AA88W288_9ASTE|nr:hypothetical protein RJ639_007225 [Escallonia herrerae]